MSERCATDQVPSFMFNMILRLVIADIILLRLGILSVITLSNIERGNKNEGRMSNSWDATREN